MTAALEQLVGAPFGLDELKHKPGRRRTLRVHGPRGTVIVKVYASDRAGRVAARLAALRGGPPEPRVPDVLHVDRRLRTLVLTDVEGEPLRVALLAGDGDSCARVGAALARWHGFWRERAPAVLAPHTVERELELLVRGAERAPAPVAAAVRDAVRTLGPLDWRPRTAVHRDLYEEQILLGPSVGLIDLDDAALGPPELDVGNLLAHVDLLARRSGRELDGPAATLVAAYEAEAGPLDAELLGRCRELTLLRLACIHADADLL